MAKNKQGAASQAAPKTVEAGTETAERKRKAPGDGAEGDNPANASMVEKLVRDAYDETIVDEPAMQRLDDTGDEKCAICGEIRQAQEDE